MSLAKKRRPSLLYNCCDRTRFTQIKTKNNKKGQQNESQQQQNLILIYYCKKREVFMLLKKLLYLHTAFTIYLNISYFI